MSGVGTKLITAYDQPALGAVYKIVAIEDETGELRNTIKLSNNVEKVSTPGKKQVWRNTSHEKGSLRRLHYPMTALMSMAWKSWKCSIQPIPTSIKRSKNFDAVPLFSEHFQEGNLVRISRPLTEIQAYAQGI